MKVRVRALGLEFKVRALWLWIGSRVRVPKLRLGLEGTRLRSDEYRYLLSINVKQDECILVIIILVIIILVIHRWWIQVSDSSL